MLQQIPVPENRPRLGNQQEEQASKTLLAQQWIDFVLTEGSMKVDTKDMTPLIQGNRLKLRVDLGRTLVHLLKLEKDFYI